MLPAAAAGARDGAYYAAMDAGMRHFYGRAFPAARDDFGRALTRDPGDPLAQTFYVAASVRAGERLDALVASLEERAAAAPTDASAQALVGFAELFDERGNPDRHARARFAFERARALGPAAPAAHVGLGIMAFERHAAAAAKRELSQALEVDPGDVLAREYLSQLDLLYLREPVAAIAVLIDVTNTMPGYADAYYHLGEAALAAHRNEVAAAFLERCLRLDPKGVGEGGRYGGALLARAYEESGHVEDAKRVRREGVADE